MIVLYLTAIVLANLSIAQFGPQIAIVNAFLFIGLDLTARDALHDRWANKNLLRNMSVLIATGSILSWLLNRDAGQIALASFAAFGLAAIADTAGYGVLRNRSKLARINGSNIAGAAIDSVAFPAIAFGFPLMFGVMACQFLSKVLGGFIWSLLINVAIGERGNSHRNAITRSP